MVGHGSLLVENSLKKLQTYFLEGVEEKEALLS
jgi:hypothetical protein